MPSKTYDIAIIGGGAVGLSLAYELANVGGTVCVLDRREFGREASWAGAGIIPPASGYHDHPALHALATLSRSLFPEWSQRLRNEVDIDNGWRISGGVYLAANKADSRRLERYFDKFRARGVIVERLNDRRLAEVEPALSLTLTDERHSWDTPAAYFLPSEAQIHNPKHVCALAAACERLGVDLHPNCPVEDFEVRGGQILALRTGCGRIVASRYCLTAGAWTGHLAALLGIANLVKPIRGQIALLKNPGKQPLRIVHWDGRYVVPRGDGRILVGSTVEDVGFDASTTDHEIEQLRAIAARLLPSLTAVEPERAWAGLRPATKDQLPYMGPLPDWQNAWIASGHYRSGLQLSPATAVVMSALIRGVQPPVDVSSLAVERPQPEPVVRVEH